MVGPHYGGKLLSAPLPAVAGPGRPSMFGRPGIGSAFGMAGADPLQADVAATREELKSLALEAPRPPRDPPPPPPSPNRTRRVPHPVLIGAAPPARDADAATRAQRWGVETAAPQVKGIFAVLSRLEHSLSRNHHEQRLGSDQRQTGGGGGHPRRHSEDGRHADKTADEHGAQDRGHNTPAEVAALASFTGHNGVAPAPLEPYSRLHVFHDGAQDDGRRQI